VKLTETAHDILSELNFSAFFEGRPHAAAGHDPAVPHELGMDKDHKILLDALGFDSRGPRCIGRSYRIQTRSRVLDDADPRARRPRSAAPGAATPESLEPEVKDNVLDLLIYLFENS